MLSLLLLPIDTMLLSSMPLIKRLRFTPWHDFAFADFRHAIRLFALRLIRYADMLIRHAADAFRRCCHCQLPRRHMPIDTPLRRRCRRHLAAFADVIDAADFRR